MDAARHFLRVHLRMCGEPGEALYTPMVALGDVNTGAHAMGAVACALLYRERTGKGKHLDIFPVRYLPLPRGRRRDGQSEHRRVRFNEAVTHAGIPANNDLGIEPSICY